MTGVKDKVALVTGCGSAGGIGFACAKLLKAAGAKVAITSTTDRIHERAQELGDGVFAHPCDLTDVAQVDGLVNGNAKQRSDRSTLSSTMPAWCRPVMMNRRG